MIDTEKMRADHGTYHHVPDDQPHCNLPIEECRRCAVDALCDENDELRREVERLNELLSLANYTLIESYDEGSPQAMALAMAILDGDKNAVADAKQNMQKRQERQKSDWICAVCDGGPGNYCNCSCPNGPVKQNTGSWLPAPDTMPDDLAPAQWVRTRDSWNGETGVAIAGTTPWDCVSEYRPLYSDSGLPLCSAEGLEEWARFVETDQDGETVWQFQEYPDKNKCDMCGGEADEAPSTHRKPGDWRDSLMEVTRR